MNACIARMQAMQDDWQHDLEELQSELEQQAGAVYWQREAAKQQVVDLGSRLSELGEQLRQLWAVEAVSSGGVVQDTPDADASSPDDSEEMPVLTASQRRRRRKVYARRGVAAAATLQQQVTRSRNSNNSNRVTNSRHHSSSGGRASLHAAPATAAPPDQAPAAQPLG
mgnify:CR=1 FL=1